MEGLGVMHGLVCTFAAALVGKGGLRTESAGSRRVTMAAKLVRPT